MKLIGLLGQANVGKTTVSNWFKKKDFVEFSLSEPMKLFAKRLFNFNDEQLFGSSDARNQKIAVNPEYWFGVVSKASQCCSSFVNGVTEECERIKAFLSLMDLITQIRTEYPWEISARPILQLIGTEWGRLVNSKIWTNYLFRKADTYLALHPKAPGIIVPDVRFINEVVEFRERDGIILKINRPGLKYINTTGRENHPSEHQQSQVDSTLIDAVLDLPEGVEAVHKFLDDYKEAPWDRK